MTNSKPLFLVLGVASLVALTYIGFGAANQQNIAQAEGESKWQTSGVPVVLDNDNAKLGYAYGARIASDLVAGGITSEINVDAFLEAMRQVMQGGEARMSVEEMQQAFQSFQLRQQQAYAQMAQDNLTQGKEFLEKIKSEEGIKTTESGLMYEVVREGKGKKPTAQSKVRVHYLGTLADGTPFDSSYDRGQPTDFSANAVIPGFSEGLQLMSEGAKYRFVIPSELGYGEQASPAIGPNQVLIFEVELIAVDPAPETDASK